MFELSSDTRVAEIQAESPAMLAALTSTGIYNDGDDAEVEWLRCTHIPLV